MSAKTKSVLVASLSVLALLLVLQVLTYVLLAEAAMPRTAARFLPQYNTCFVEGTAFACVSDRTWSKLSPKHRETLDEVLRDHFETIYHSEREIPADRWMLHPSDSSRRLGLKDGCIINWTVSRRGLFWFSAWHEDWESLTAGSSRKAAFVWFLGTWMKLWTGSTATA